MKKQLKTTQIKLSQYVMLGVLTGILVFIGLGVNKKQTSKEKISPERAWAKEYLEKARSGV